MKAQLGETITFDKGSSSSVGVFRTISRDCYSFPHLALALVSLLGHLWHGGRALFQDPTADATIEVVQELMEYGSNERTEATILGRLKPYLISISHFFV